MMKRKRRNHLPATCARASTNLTTRISTFLKAPCGWRKSFNPTRWMNLISPWPDKPLSRRHSQ